MKIALFGGTFDPIHAGHLRAAKVAADEFGLHAVLFVPSGNPPHKARERLTPFAHRLAMVSLACAGDRRLIPSLLEAPHDDGRIYYSVDTARAVRKSLAPGDALYFLLGLDSFFDLPNWREYTRLFDLMDFIVVSRPGLRSQDLLTAIPAAPAARARRALSRAASNHAGTVFLGRAAIHLLRGVEMPVASRDIRAAVRAGRKVTGLVPQLVEEYILKEGLYSPHSRPESIGPIEKENSGRNPLEPEPPSEAATATGAGPCETVGIPPFLGRAIAAAQGRKALDVDVLNLKGICSFTDFFLVCSGTSTRHTQAICDAIRDELDDSGMSPAHVEGYAQAEWILLDYLNFVVHIFVERARQFYELERLWKKGAKTRIKDE